MKKQKHGFWVFIFSLIPGAGEMYMGFKKQGLSIMLLFWGSIALASITGLGWLPSTQETLTQRAASSGLRLPGSALGQSCRWTDTP